ncbi:hypothetical protein ACH50O_11555 [Methylomonas sp. 2BW1-5-20]|uniref:hypothetical protein n=1 Tax=Methylomonas sp. 2BW1-5-20 TaxID=3376686 RepID=UPI00404DD70F
MAAPKLPRTDTLTGRALMRLMTGRKFTHRDYQNETASYRLSGYIEQLRNRHGWPIESTEETAPTKDPIGRNATYSRYSLDPEFLRSVRAEMGERFDNFIEAVKRFEAKGEK